MSFVRTVGTRYTVVMFPSYSALVESGTRILLALNFYSAPLRYMTKTMRDTQLVLDVHYPNYQGSFAIAYADPTEYPQWTWDAQERLFVKTPSDLLTDAVQKRSRLAIAKVEVIGKIMQNLSARRNSVGDGITFQEMVYLSKRQQVNSSKERDIQRRPPYTLMSTLCR